MGCYYCKPRTGIVDVGIYLTDDIWIQIFLHLPVNSIYKFKCVSKVWLSLLSNSDFINKWAEINCSSSNKSHPWIIFHSLSLLPQGDNPNSFLFSYPKTLESQFLSGNEHGFSFKFVNPNSYEEYLVPLASSNGLVLCGIRSSNCYYCVCNPLTQTWVSLPPPPTSSVTLQCLHGFICESISSPILLSTTCYKVVRIPNFGEKSNNFSIEIFSSILGEWNTYQVSCPRDIKWKIVPSNSLVIRRGVMYWIEGGESILVYNLNNMEDSGETGGNMCRLISFPDQDPYGNYLGSADYETANTHCLGESEGLLCFATIKRSCRTLSVWVLEEDWRLLHKDIDLNNFFAALDMKLYASQLRGDDSGLQLGAGYKTDTTMATLILGFSPVDKNVVLLNYKSLFWAFNIRSRRCTKLLDPSFLAKSLSIYRYHIFYPFVLKPMPTILPSPSWVINSILNLDS